MAVVEYQQPGVCRVVTENTISANHYWLVATPVGSLDELMTSASLFAHFVEPQGAQLESTADGLRVSAAALGAALSGGSTEQMRVSIRKQSIKAIESDGVVLWEDSFGGLYQTNIQDLRGGNSAPYSFRGNATAGSAPTTDLHKTNIPLAVATTGSTVVGFGAGGELQRFDVSSGGIVNLEATVSPFNITLNTDTGGTPAILPLSTADDAGLVSPTQYFQLDYLANNQTFISGSQDSTTATITESPLGSTATITAADATFAGVMSSVDWVRLDYLYNNQTELALTRTATTNVIDNSPTGVGVTLLLADASNAGLFSPEEKALLESLSTGSTNLSTDYSPTWVNIVNSTGSDARINPADYLADTAGAMSAADNRVIQKLYTAPSESVLVYETGDAEPAYKQRGNFTQRQLLTNCRLLGFDESSRLSVFQPSTGGGGTASNQIKMTAHSLTVNDVAKPIVDGGIFDDTSTTTWPTGILLAIVDPDTVEIPFPGQQFTVPAALIDPGYIYAADNRWMSWDSSSNYWTTPKPDDTVGDMSEQIEILESAGGGDFYAVWHDHGPLGSAAPISGGGGTPSPGTEEVYLSNGVPGDGNASDFKVALDITNNNWYRSTGSNWVLAEDGGTEVITPNATLNVSNLRTVRLGFSGSTLITTITGHFDNHVVTLIDSNGNAPVQHADGAIELDGKEDWSTAVPGSLTLISWNNVWYETGRARYSPKTNLIAGYA